MKQRLCSQCAYGMLDPAFWMQRVSLGWSNVIQCANSEEAPGRLRAVVPSGTCRNFVVRHDPSYRLPPPGPAPEGSRYISLTRGYFAIVDEADHEWLSKYEWLAMISDNTVYAFRKVRGKVIFMHREIMKPRKGRVVDHINHNGVDNRRCNLRHCLPRQNACNARARSGTSRYRGVCRDGNRWTAYIGHLSVRVRIALFADEAEAARARDRKAIELHGQYAFLNFPEEWPADKREALHNSPEARQARAEVRRRGRKPTQAGRKPAPAGRPNPKSEARSPKQARKEPKA